MKINYYTDDLPDEIDLGNSIAIDTETTGLSLYRDRLCTVQICDNKENVYVVHLKGNKASKNLNKILADNNVLKIFHYGRFDIAFIKNKLDILCENVYCTKIASKLTRTNTNRHGLKSICNDLLNIDIKKDQQTSDWGSDNLSQEQLKYAANDVLYLHRLKNKLDALLIRENRLELANKCFNFLPIKATLDLLDWQEDDIFNH